jgi:class 3 adenylate cyclase
VTVHRLAQGPEKRLGERPACYRVGIRYPQPGGETVPDLAANVNANRDDHMIFGDGSTRGFLFADLRGYTHLVDTRGAVEASHLLGRYRAIVREVVTHHGGAEIKTEGDSFYVVLPSASAALRCGLDILRSCTTPSDGGEAIKLGIGIHAGESVAHEGGFVGSAINIAARICALATAGEVLVTGTIRELTRSIVSAKFVFVGRRQLKGLDQPVEVFRVVPDGAVSPVRRRSLGVAAGHPLSWLVVAVIVIVGVGTGGAYAFGWRPISGLLGAGSSATPAASSGQSTSQLAASPSVLLAQLPANGSSVDAGTYAPNGNRDVVSVTIPECCWKVAADIPDLLFFGHAGAVGTGSGFGVGIAHITVVYTGDCETDATRLIGEDPQGLVDWVQSAPQFDATNPHAVLNLGLSGIEIEATVLAPPAGSSCSQRSATLWAVGSGSWDPNIGTHIRFEAMEAGSRTLTIVYAAADAAGLSYARGVGAALLGSMVLRN